MSSNTTTNVSNAGYINEEINIGITDPNKWRGENTYGLEKIAYYEEFKDLEGIYSGMLTPSESGFYTSRTNVKTLDLIGEGPIEGLVSGEYLLTGNVGDIGYSELEILPVEMLNPESWLNSIQLNETPIVGDGNLYNYQNVEAAFFNGAPEGLIISDNFLGFNNVSSLEKTRIINERLMGPDPDASTESPFTTIQKSILFETKRLIKLK
jgi:hypothetical protein